MSKVKCGSVRSGDAGELTSAEAARLLHFFRDLCEAVDAHRSVQAASPAMAALGWGDPATVARNLDLTEATFRPADAAEDWSLVHRAQRGQQAAVTDAGWLLYARAREVVGVLRSSAERLSDRQSVTVGATNSFIHYHIAEFFAGDEYRAFTERHPLVALRFVCGEWWALVRGLAADSGRRSALALGPRIPGAPVRVQHKLIDIEPVLIYRKGTAFAAKVEGTKQPEKHFWSLLQGDWTVFSLPEAVQPDLDLVHELQQRKSTARVVVLPEQPQIHQMVLAGVGVGLLHHRSVVCVDSGEVDPRLGVLDAYVAKGGPFRTSQACMHLRNDWKESLTGPEAAFVRAVGRHWKVPGFDE